MAKIISSKKYRYIIGERNYPSEQFSHGKLKDRVNKYMIKNLYNKADVIIGNSKANCLDLTNNFGCDKNKVHVIYNPIDVVKIQEIEPISNFFDPQFFNVIAVGRLQPVKNHELLIRAIRKFENVRLYILGSGELRNKLERLISEEKLENKVFLLGFDKNPYKYLKGADIFALSSKHEGFPNVLLEAMACALPVVSTNCKSGPSELMKLKKEKNDLMSTDYGILVPPNDVELMAKGIQYMFENPEYLKSCKKNCLDRAEDFKKQSILKDYISVLNNN